MLALNEPKSGPRPASCWSAQRREQRSSAAGPAYLSGAFPSPSLAAGLCLRSIRIVSTVIARSQSHSHTTATASLHPPSSADAP